MEMDAFQANHNWDCFGYESAEQLLHPEAPGLCHSCRDVELLPRVGDQYQVETPHLASRSAYLKLTEVPTDAAILPGTPQSFLVGLPVSVTWISEEAGKIMNQKVELSSDLNIMSNGNATSLQTTENGTSQPCGVKGHLVPGSMRQTWNDVEEAAFLLGLYIFGKNFVVVKKFVESKRMEDIQSFYYGKFYRSTAYQRWLECWKVRSRRCIFGQKIFTGLRQQRLLSLLLPRLSDESKKTLLEVAKGFGAGKMLLEEYVFSLKAIVGLNALIDAVGVGKGKQHLTGIAVVPSKSNQAALIRPEIPKGKASSSLAPQEIIDFLTGGYRLSKARSNDLFWEAVWPRLLARGWHSEQPSDHFSTANRQSLVFLRPGIKKFSRRKLVRGKHYFDSVTDVLNKVVSNPSLLELAIGADTGAANKEENGWANETSSKREDSPEQQHHRYLKPRTPLQGTDAVRFTVVDTSLASGGTNKVRELRSLPAQMRNTSAPQSDPENSDGDSSEEETSDKESADKLPSSCLKSLISCGQMGSGCGVPSVLLVPSLPEDKVGGNSGNPNFGRNTASDYNPPQKKLSPTSSLFSVSSDVKKIPPDSKIPREKPQLRTLFDLNILPSPEDASEASIVETGRLQNGTSAPRTPCDTSFHQPPNMNSQRHSTRNRPPTAKVLEALAAGYYGTTTHKRMRKDSCPLLQNSMTKPSRRPRSCMPDSKSFNVGIMNLEEYNSATEISHCFQLLD